MFERKSLKWPITLAVVMIVLIGGLTTGWILLNVFGALESQASAGLYWTWLSIGSVMFAGVLTGVILYLILTIKQHNLSARQSNFIDAVTHELKSPICSLKLYLQTLNRRNVDENQRQEFYSSMLHEVDRLDQLISQLLDVARISHKDERSASETTTIRTDQLIKACVSEVCARHQIEAEVIHCDLQPIELLGRHIDLEIAFRNLIDNAIKYAGNPPEIFIRTVLLEQSREFRAVIGNNGATVAKHLRRQVFQRFYRIGSELERTKPGTGLGLYLVRLVIRRMKGKVAMIDPHGSNSTTTNAKTEVELILPNARFYDQASQVDNVHLLERSAL